VAPESGDAEKLTVTPERFRTVLRHVPTSVTVVAGLVDGEPTGLSVGSFVPVSLEPPLVGFFVATTSTSWPRIEPTGRYCVNVLSEAQADVSSRFARSSLVADKFDGVRWRPSPSGMPILKGAVAWVDCTLHELHGAGDHLLVLGRVEALGVETGATPLLHHGGSYRRAHDLAPDAEARADASAPPGGSAGPDLAGTEG
jgi:3-hydroxy-9,10-secoandrosta-1,3,5(10)-triene-9,17-dione monooxygenase reductase component